MRTLVLGIVMVALVLQVNLVYAQRTEPNIATNGNVYIEIPLVFERSQLKPVLDRMEISFTTKNLTSIEAVKEPEYILLDNQYFYFNTDVNVPIEDNRTLIKQISIYIEVYEREFVDTSDITSYWGYGILDIEGNQWPVEGQLYYYGSSTGKLEVISH